MEEDKWTLQDLIDRKAKCKCVTEYDCNMSHAYQHDACFGIYSEVGFECSKCGESFTIIINDDGEEFEDDHL